ncbi:MAG: hypothetical protein ABEI86_09990, partial [Halobacteriaceae archaeon]
MQRRAALISAVVLVGLAAGSYGMLATAEAPPITITAAKEVSEGQTFTLGGLTYNVTKIKTGDPTFVSFKWHDPNATYTKKWENDSNVTYNGDLYRIIIPNVSSPQNFTLVEIQNVTAPTYVENGTRYVVVDQDEDGDKDAVPVSEYLPAPKRFTFELNQTFQYQGNTTTVISLKPSEALLRWFAPKNKSARILSGNNFTAENAGTFLVYIPSESRVILSQNFQGYNHD